MHRLRSGDVWTMRDPSAIDHAVGVLYNPGFAFAGKFAAASTQLAVIGAPVLG